MDLDQMRGFLETAREKSFTRAAAKLFLTQPAVSLQVKALETEFGTRLFERQGKQVLLTDAGRLLYERSEEVLDLVARVHQDIASLGELKTGRLYVGTSDTNCAYVLPPVVKGFREAYPGIELRLMDRMSKEVVHLVLEGAVDFGLATMPVVESRVRTELLFVRDDVLICPVGHPLTTLNRVSLHQMIDYPMLMLAHGSTSRSLLDQVLHQAGLAARVAMELGSIEVIKRFVEIGMGVALVPEVAVRDEVLAKRMASVRVVDLPGREVGLVQRRSGHLSRAAEVFLGYLREHLVAHFPAQGGGNGV
jgi:DNA-binding transcriptional LysR family regulator